MTLGSDDVLAIQNLIYGYNHAVDSGDGDAMAALFEDDATLGVGLPDLIEGKEAIRQMGASVSTMVPGVRHITTNTMIEGGGDKASARTYVQVFTTVGGAGETRLVASGIYTDTFRKDGGTWRIATRDMVNDG